MGTHLYRIAQEAINNVIQHARATQILIRLSAEDRRITLTITDDGIGLPDPADPGAGMGLRIMRYRCDLIGADLKVERAAGKRTIVRCMFPGGG